MVQHSDIDHTGITGTGSAGTAVRCRKTADETFASTSVADSTNMGLAVAASKIYKFRYVIFYDTNASTVGIKLALLGPAGADARAGIIGGVAPAAGAGNAQYNLAAVSGDISTDLLLFSPSAGPGADDQLVIIEGIVLTDVTAGTLKLRHGSETATNTTIFANSHGELWEVT